MRWIGLEKVARKKNSKTDLILQGNYTWAKANSLEAVTFGNLSYKSLKI